MAGKDIFLACQTFWAFIILVIVRFNLTNTEYLLNCIDIEFSVPLYEIGKLISNNVKL